jgi:hypothetical protein
VSLGITYLFEPAELLAGSAPMAVSTSNIALLDLGHDGSPVPATEGVGNLSSLGGGVTMIEL